MKYLVFFFMISAAHATTLSQYISSPNGSSEQRFEIDKSSVKYIKRSNFFDKTKSYSLGSFETEGSKIGQGDLKKLEQILTKIKSVDEFLKKKSSSFNEFSEKTPHDSFLILNEYRISQKSDLYPELKAIYDRIQKLNWKQENGVKLSDDLKTLTIMKNGKETSKEPFNFAFHCQKREAPTVCGYKDYGILFVE